MENLKFAPREIFEYILEYAAIPTFDLVIEVPSGGVILVRRKIAPYANQWALPGLRMLKPEGIEDTLVRIAKNEVGLNIDPRKRIFLGQFVGRFRTEHNRQDLSTGYAVRAESVEVILNSDHFSSWKLIDSVEDVPSNIGAMYKFYLECYFDNRGCEVPLPRSG
ncbi:NUDIX domain-containing protein [Nitrolancea hollandica]|uniref:Nudix hydrolase domain-containing protein n=1 Tax=Nitrolancea hollandica Lb TaxID=1129897 RepID=I4EC84_9BACT|nr:NUDIX domain-containing protein [Nitrolancea hollandica]CCF82296.1 hypothetical protein NITHO_100012 [Nitrolancea hollandica Lb]